MCKEPIRIKNNSKYIADNVGHQYYIWVNCGHCEECIKAKQNEWTLRTYYQCKEVIKAGGYIYFDTLTYRNEDLPRLSNFMETNGENWSCFNYRHIRQFYESLRQKLKLKKDDKVKYFITSEYGELRHRNHYHIMLFIYDNDIDALQLSKLVSECWKRGRTDGLPYKSKKYVKEHNVLNTICIDCIRYIAKYVNKSQTFMDVINKRWERLEKFYEISKYNKIQIKKIRQQYYRMCTPFHRQSRNFGIEAIKDKSIEELIKEPILWFKNSTLSINTKVRLPMYYYRRLFAKQIKYNGKRIWINNEDGIRYKKAQEENNIDAIKTRLIDSAATLSKELSEEEATNIAMYIYFERGRLKGKIDYKPHHEDASKFNYNTTKDLIYLGKKCISKNFAGNDKIGYCTTDIEPIDIEKDVYINKEYETRIAELTNNNDKDTKNLVKLKEHLNEIKKLYFT